MRFHIFSVTGIVREQKPQSFYTDVMDGVSSLVEMVSDRLVSVVFYDSQVFLEAGVEGASPFADAEFGASGAVNNVHDVVRLPVELFVMFIMDFGPLMLTLVHMKGHVSHFSWLQGVVPGVLAAGCRSFDRTNMSRILVSHLYAISGGGLKIFATSVRAGDSSTTG